MNYNQIVFAKSTDHGATFTTPVTLSTNSWSDTLDGRKCERQRYLRGLGEPSVLPTASSHNGGSDVVSAGDAELRLERVPVPERLAVLPNGTALRPTRSTRAARRRARGR
jgi:hypothetical protein